MNASLADAFKKFCSVHFGKSGKPVGTKEINLTNAQYGIFFKLAYFELIRKDEKEKSKRVITSKGYDFYRGSEILDTVATMGGEILDRNHEAWDTHKDSISLITLESTLEKKYKQKEGYVSEMCNSTLR